MPLLNFYVTLALLHTVVVVFFLPDSDHKVLPCYYDVRENVHYGPYTIANLKTLNVNHYVLVAIGSLKRMKIEVYGCGYGCGCVCVEGAGGHYSSVMKDKETLCADTFLFFINKKY